MVASTTTVLYEQGAKFDMVEFSMTSPSYTVTNYVSCTQDYYLKTHMPLVESKWKQYGLKGWKVLQFPSDAPYTVGATLEWDSKEDFEKALGSEETKEVLGDVPNFSDKNPTLMPGDVKGTN